MRIKFIKEEFPSPVGNGKFFKKDDIVVLDEPHCSKAIDGGYAKRWFPEDEKAENEAFAKEMATHTRKDAQHKRNSKRKSKNKTK